MVLSGLLHNLCDGDTWRAPMKTLHIHLSKQFTDCVSVPCPFHWMPRSVNIVFLFAVDRILCTDHHQTRPPDSQVHVVLHCIVEKSDRLRYSQALSSKTCLCILLQHHRPRMDRGPLPFTGQRGPVVDPVMLGGGRRGKASVPAHARLRDSPL